MAIKRQKKLTIKQTKFVERYLATGNATQSALDIGYKNGVSGRENLQKPTIQKTIQDARDKNLKKAGITLTKVYKRLNEELDAVNRRVISAIISPTGKQQDATGQTCDFIEVDIIDHRARDRAIEKCLVLMGHLKQNGADIKVATQVFVGSDFSNWLKSAKDNQARSDAGID